MNNLLKVLFVVVGVSGWCINVLAQENVDAEQFFHQQKQLNYEKLSSSIVVHENFASDDGLSYVEDRHVVISIQLKEQFVSEQLRGATGIILYKESPELYARVLRGLTDVMNDMPFNTYISFSFSKIMLEIEVSVTQEGLDYLNSRNDVFINEIQRIGFDL